MNIAILLLNKGRGSGEVAREHVRHLLKLGHKVYFLYPGNSEGIAGAENVDIVLHTEVYPVHEYLPSAGESQKQVARMTADEMAAYLPDYEQALESIAADVDIFIGHHANLSAVAVHNVANKFNKPYVLFLHGTGIEPRHDGLWDKLRLKLIQNSIEALKNEEKIVELEISEICKNQIARLNIIDSKLNALEDEFESLSRQNYRKTVGGR